MKIRFLIAAAGLAAFAANAQPAPNLSLPAAHVDKTGPENVIRHVGGADLKAALNSKKPSDALTEVLLSGGNGYRVSNTLRDRDGLVEYHDEWYDHIFVQEGEATFLTGGTMVGAADTAPGEKRAASITGGTSTALHAGDYFMIPPHTPHQMLVAKGHQIRFVVFKIRK
ncbi:MAG TPA: cupin domain-containing protein [Rhizomicrobium sp.]|nr:cupin domain-containing protein [Rhizomicrobium sp.]